MKKHALGMGLQPSCQTLPFLVSVKESVFWENGKYAHCLRTPGEQPASRKPPRPGGSQASEPSWVAKSIRLETAARNPLRHFCHPSFSESKNYHAPLTRTGKLTLKRCIFGGKTAWLPLPLVDQSPFQWGFRPVRGTSLFKQEASNPNPGRTTSCSHTADGLEIHPTHYRSETPNE